ncbi:MAG: hypothetical protein ACP5T9_06605 [Thermoplasmata archaeon]
MEILNRRQVILNREFTGGRYVQASINSNGHLVIREWFDEMIDEPFEKTDTCKNCNKKIIWDDQAMHWVHEENNSECNNPTPSEKIHYYEPEEKLLIFDEKETEAVTNFVLEYLKKIQKENNNRRLW